MHTLLKILALDFLLVGLCFTYKYPLNFGASLWLRLASGSDNSISSSYRDILIFYYKLDWSWSRNTKKRNHFIHFSFIFAWWVFRISHGVQFKRKNRLFHTPQQVLPIKYSDQVYKHKQFFFNSLVSFHTNRRIEGFYCNIVICYFTDFQAP